MGRLQEEDLNRLRALEATRQPSAASLIQTSNLELRRTLGTSGAGTSHPKLRTSSPLSQQQVPAKWGASPIGANGGHSYSDVSSVSHRLVPVQIRKFTNIPCEQITLNYVTQPMFSY